MAISFFLLFC